MSEPLSIAASIIAVAGAAYSGCKADNDLISAFSNAPKALQSLRQDLDTLQGLLQSLETALEGTRDDALSESQKSCFRDLKPALDGCKHACDDFAARLSGIASHSDAGRVNWMDRVRFHFSEKDVELLRSTLQKYKSTLDIALGLATLYVVLFKCPSSVAKPECPRATPTANLLSMQQNG